VKQAKFKDELGKVDAWYAGVAEMETLWGDIVVTSYLICLRII